MMNYNPMTHSVEINGIVWWGKEEPRWNWKDNDYRIVKIPDSIDWSHVEPEFKLMARDEEGMVWLYTEKPSKEDFCWFRRSGVAVKAIAFASYHKGTVGWQDSLVERPE